jgi:hypothetical protein
MWAVLGIGLVALIAAKAIIVSVLSEPEIPAWTVVCDGHGAFNFSENDGEILDGYTYDSREEAVHGRDQMLLKETGNDPWPDLHFEHERITRLPPAPWAVCDGKDAK